MRLGANVGGMLLSSGAWPGHGGAGGGQMGTVITTWLPSCTALTACRIRSDLIGGRCWAGPPQCQPRREGNSGARLG